MSHIREKEDLLQLRDYFINLMNNRTDIDTISSLVSQLVPKNEFGKNQVGVVVSDSNKRTTGYIPSYNTIYIARYNLLDVSQTSARNLCNNYNFDDVDKMSFYYQLFCILHEIEHADEFLISNGTLNFPYTEVKDGYHNLITFLKEDQKKDKKQAKKCKDAFKIYNEFPYDYIFERNANVEAAQDISFLASSFDEDKIGEIFNKLALAFSYIGYEDDNLGCMFHTFQKLKLEKEYDKIIKDDKMSDDDRLRFGLDISHESHKKLVKEMSKSGLYL